MPLRIDEAITQLDHGWLSHLKSQGYGGDALRQAIDLVLYAQQQAAARNSAEFKAAIARVNHLVGAGIACDNNGDYLYTAEWRDPACAGLGFAIEYAADPASWRAEFRMPGCWPHTVDNLDITDTRAKLAAYAQAGLMAISSENAIPQLQAPAKESGEE